MQKSAKEINDLVVVAKVGAPKGVKGMLKLQQLSDTPLSFFSEFILDHNGSQVNIDAKSITKDGPDKHLLKLANVLNPEDARAYTNDLLLVDKALLPKTQKDEYYWSDLTGLEVYSLEDICLGKVEHMQATGSNDVMFLQQQELNSNTGKNEVVNRCVPFMSSVVLKVDLELGKIIVDWDPDF